MLTAREAAKMAGVTPKQIYKWLHDGRIKGEGGPIRVDRTSLRDYLKKRESDGNRDRS